MKWDARASGRQAGFSLIEMIVVLAILGMMVGLIVSRGPMRSPRLDLDGAAREVAGTLRLARAHAIAQDRIVVWLAGPGGFRLDDGALHRLPADIALRGSARIGFAGDGSSSAGRSSWTAAGGRSRSG